MIIPAVTVAAAIAMGQLAGPGAPGALTAMETFAAASQTVVPAKRHSDQCWRKKHNKHVCIPFAGGGYVSSPPGQRIRRIGGGYVSTRPGDAIPPVGGGYVSSPPGVGMPPVGGGFASSSPGQAISPSGSGYVSTPPGQAIPPSG